MPKFQTTVSLNNSLLQRIDNIAQEMNISRSHLASIALEQFVERYQNRKMFDALNKVYKDEPDAYGQQILREVKLKYQKMFEDEWE